MCGVWESLVMLAQGTDVCCAGTLEMLVVFVMFCLPWKMKETEYSNAFEKEIKLQDLHDLISRFIL